MKAAHYARFTALPPLASVASMAASCCLPLRRLSATAASPCVCAAVRTPLRGIALTPTPPSLSFWSRPRPPLSAPAAAASAPQQPHKQPRQPPRTSHSHVDARRRTPPSKPYAFPVGRALRYVQLGRRYHHRAEGPLELREWLSEADSAVFAEEADAGDSHEGSAAPDSEVVVAKVSSFAKYHAHRVLTEFKALRHRIGAAAAAETRATATSATATTAASAASHESTKRRRGEGKSDRARRASSQPSSPAAAPVAPPPLSAETVAALTHALFSAAVLLHVSGLFGVADTHVERLLEVCFSVSIFLAQDAATAAVRTRQQQQRRQRQPTGERRGSGASAAVADPLAGAASRGSPNAAARAKSPLTDATPLVDAGPPLFASSPTCLSDGGHVPLHSLLYAIVHFAAGVQHWGLLDHVGALQNVRRTQRPYERLLQAHAALLGEQARGLVDSIVWEELMALKAGRRAAPARDAWFMGSDAALYAKLLESKSKAADASLAASVPTRLQQRRLQLLPLLWLSFLTAHLQASTATEPPGRGVTWLSARYAFVSVLPLFAMEARLDVTAWAMLHLLCLPHRPPQRPLGSTRAASETNASLDAAASAGASLTEVCALLAHLERGGAMAELAAALPTKPGARASGEDAGDTRVHLHLASFLRRWLDATAAAAAGQHATRHTHRHGTRDNGCAASHGIRSAGELYRAVLNVPVCALFLPTASAVATTGSRTPGVSAAPTHARPPVTAEGVQLVTRLLLRVLLQWRRDGRGWRGGAGGPDGVRVSTQGVLVTAEGAVGDSDISPAPTRRLQAAKALPPSPPGRPHVPITAAADSRAQWEREVVCVLKALHHLQALLRITEKAGCEDVRAGLFVAPTVQAVARALAVQLGSALLPWRLGLRHTAALLPTPTESRLLGAVDAALCGVLAVPLSARRDADDERGRRSAGTGMLPASYRASMQALLPQPPPSRTHATCSSQLSSAEGTAR